MPVSIQLFINPASMKEQREYLNVANRHLRRIIWLMTRNVIQHNSLFRAFFLKKRREGQAYKKAMFATSHKLIRVVFALLSKKIYFDQTVHS